VTHSAVAAAGMWFSVLLTAKPLILPLNQSLNLFIYLHQTSDIHIDQKTKIRSTNIEKISTKAMNHSAKRDATR